MTQPALPLDGDMEILGRLPYSSNYTFLVKLSDDSQAIYKPAEGEQPLHDFPPDIYKREVAAYRLAQQLGWPNVPETHVVPDGPHGVGSLQRFVEADFEHHYFSLLEDQSLHQQFWEIAVFDVVANNADRKSGHCLVDAARKIWAIDHGLCFNADPKLRTVIWEFGGTTVPAPLLNGLASAADSEFAELHGLLEGNEIEALGLRTRALIETPVLPEPVSQRQYPWPLL